jgi:hypothetical protein
LLCKQKDGRSEDAPSDFAEVLGANNLTCRSSAGSPAANVNVELVLVTARPAHQYLQCLLVLRCVHRLVTWIHSFVHMTSVLRHLDLPPSHTRPVYNSFYFLIDNPVHRASVASMYDRITHSTTSYSFTYVSGWSRCRFTSSFVGCCIHALDTFNS